MFIRGIFEAGSIPVLERVLSFTEARHEVLAANVANAETPGWRRRDLAVGEFTRELEKAISARKSAPGRFRMKEVDLNPVLDRGPFTFERSGAGMLRHDGNNVDLDREMALLARNALLHNTVASLLRQRFSSLRTAVSGRATTA